MEVKSGYSQTEVGVIPASWEVTSLERVFALKHGFAFSSEHFSKTGPIVLTPGNFRLDGGLYFQERNTKRYSGTYSPDMVFSRGDLLIVMTDLTPDCNLLGKPAFVDTDELVLHNQRIGKVILKDRDAQLPFLFYALLSRAYLSHVKEQAFGSTVRHTSNKSIYSAQLAWPKSFEQKAIAEALSDVDALLGGLERLIAKKRDLKQAAMQQLLTGQTRLPGFCGEWEMKRLGDVAEMGSGGTPLSSVAAYYDGDVPWVSISDMTNAGKFIHKTERNLTSLGFRDSAAQMFPAGTVLYAMYASLGECSIAGVPVCTSQAILGIRPKRELYGEFLYHFLTSLKSKVKTLGQQGTQANLNKGMVQDFQLALPSPSEQTAIAAVLSDMDAELSALEARSDKTRALKQGMMQELLTGRIRLTNVVPDDLASIQKHAPSDPRSRNWQFNEAVVVAMLVKQFGSEQYPLGRKRCTKLGYLMHRHVERTAQGYLKKAAGPYNPAVKYKGPETIAQKNGYIRPHTSGKFSGFVAAGKIAEAEGYFDKWYGREVLAWLEQFRHQTNDELELLATVDMAIVDMKRLQAEANVAAVKSIILDHPEWETKLEREIFSDANIARAIGRVTELFAE